MPPCLTLSIIRYGSRVKLSSPGKGVAPFPTGRCCSYWKKSLRVTLNHDPQLYIHICSSHRSISFRESMPLLRESVTHWPINWQSALIPSSSQELFFWSLFCRTENVRESLELAEGTYLSHMTATDSTWNTSLTASFKHASYEPRTSIQTSDAKRHFLTLTPSRLLLINHTLLCC